MRRLVNKDVKDVELKAGDTVIFSSRCIPGNEAAIAEIQESFINDGLTVVNSATDFVHVSGHPCQDELKEMYAWVKPKILIPVHGEKEHIKAHSEFAKENGIPQTIIPRNGDIIVLDKLQVIDNIKPQKFVLDNGNLIPYDSPKFGNRLHLSKAGVIFVSVMMSSDNILGKPNISLEGTSGAITYEFVHTKIMNAVTKIDKEKNVKDALNNSLRRALSKIVPETPVVVVHVFKIKQKN